MKENGHSTVEGSMPDWAKNIFDAIASTITFKGYANIEGYYSATTRFMVVISFVESCSDKVRKLAIFQASME